MDNGPWIGRCMASGSSYDAGMGNWGASMPFYALGMSRWMTYGSPHGPRMASYGHEMGCWRPISQSVVTCWATERPVGFPVVLQWVAERPVHHSRVLCSIDVGLLCHSTILGWVGMGQWGTSWSSYDPVRVAKKASCHPVVLRCGWMGIWASSGSS
jgi:hypothetical protein